MTSEQASWLRSHKTYTPVTGYPPSGHAYQRRVILHTDGTFTEVGPRRPPIAQGDIEVGILTKTANLERR